MNHALRLWRVLRVEDLILFGWLAFVEPFLFGPHRDGLDSLTRKDMLVGLTWTIAAGLAILGVATRNPDEPTMEWMTRDTPHAYAPFPLMIGVAVAAGLGVQKSGIAPAEAGILPALGLVLGAYVFYSFLPSVSVSIRRALMLPIAVSGSGILSRLLLGLLYELDAGALLSRGASMVVFFLGLSAAFYVAFVLAPSQIAEPSGTWREWAARYTIYGATLIVSVAVSYQFAN